jgi:hypothetical protein
VRFKQFVKRGERCPTVLRFSAGGYAAYFGFRFSFRAAALPPRSGFRSTRHESQPRP